MPKFLDAPSWYDNTGTLRTLSGTVRFNSVAGYVDLPYTSFASGGAYSSYYVLTSAGTNGNIAYSNGTSPAWLSNGTSGQVLTSNGNAAPSWGSLLYLHCVLLTQSYSATTFYGVCFSFFSSRVSAYSLSDFEDMKEDFYSQYGGNTDTMQFRFPAYGSFQRDGGNYVPCQAVAIWKDSSSYTLTAYGYTYTTYEREYNSNLNDPTVLNDICFPLVP